ncbi:phytase [Luteimonas sp. 3794]|uniref:phytase n=1 Tax=Luteimonas sp. 3794 TaxID=2817730 RepID=UPI00285794E1|nr:phytase [Luteimonas sp. 3794]MDR6991545.1 3-phytase [Luteimonas sp. 3794]
MRIAFLFAAALLAGCTAAPQRPTHPSGDATSEGATAEQAVIAEAWRSSAHADDEFDSLATWPTPDGGTWLIATAKRAHQLRIFDADTGAMLRTVGAHGAMPGKFDRPNGIAVHGDLVFVVERDNHRVQVFSLPDFRPLAAFGAGELRSPYGLWVHETAPDIVEVYVTDSFMEGADHRQVPDFASLDQRVRRFRFEAHDGASPKVTALGAFGATDPQTALRIVESIAGDAAYDQLLIADEDLRHNATVHVYTLDGAYTGRAPPAGTFKAEPEGIALWSCGVDSGYWIVSDQLRPRTVFRVFDRGQLTPAGSFVGARVAATDGITLHASPTARFPAGALFAVDDDAAVVAFDLRDVVTALQLDPDCR